MTRLNLWALAGAAILSAGFLAASVPAQARCVGIANCANVGGNQFAPNPGLARQGVNIAKPGPGLNGAGVIGQNGANMVGRNGSGLVGNAGGAFR